MSTAKDAPAPAFKVRPNALESSDDATMYCRYLASTPEVDREGDLILPESFDTKEWKRNNVWLWAHDQKQLPIGAGYDPEGNIACWQDEKALYLGCRFSQANPQGPVVYALYREKTLKMVSVGFIQGGSKRLTEMESSLYGYNGRANLVLNPELVECSCVPVGMNRGAMIAGFKSWDGLANREALTSHVTKGHVHGEKLTPDLVRMLEPLTVPTVLFKSAVWAKRKTAPVFRRAAWTGKIFNSPFPTGLTSLAFKH